MAKNTQPAQAAPARMRVRRRIEAAALLVLLPIAAYLWAAPLLAERALAHSSLSELIEAARKRPDDARVLHYLGRRYREAGDSHSARDTFSKAAQLNTGDEESWLGWASAALQNGDEIEAYSVVNAYLKLHPSSAPAHLALARIYSLRGVHKAAWEEAGRAAALNPALSDAWRLTGEEELLRGDTLGAEAPLRRAISLAPQDWRSHLGLGNALFARGDTAGALTSYREAVRLAPGEAAAQLCLGRALYTRARTPAEFQEAQPPLETAIKLRPDLAPAYSLLGMVYMRQGRWKEARDTLTRIDSSAPQTAELLYALQTVYEHTGEHALARQTARRHQAVVDYELKKRALISRIAMSQDTVDLRLQVARLCASHGDVSDARSYYRSAIARAPQSAAIQREFAQFEAAHNAQTSP